MSIAPEIANVAFAIRKAFRAQKAQQTGRPYRPNARWDDDDLWHNAAAACIQAQADPETWVKAVFTFSQTPGGPFPNQLCGRAAASWYENLKSSVVDPETKGPVDILDEEITMMLSNSLGWAVDMGRPLKEVLMSHCFAMPDYVRIVLMPKDPDLLKTWGNAAYTQITQNPRLCERLQARGYDLSWMDNFS